MASTARKAMTGGTTCVKEDQTVLEAARLLADLDVGSVPICGNDNRLKGVLTDRDIVVKVLAKDRDPSSVRAGDLAEGKPVTIGADDSLEEALKTMADHQVRRLPVIDGHDLVGMLSQADLVRALPDDQAGQLIKSISKG